MNKKYVIYGVMAVVVGVSLTLYLKPVKIDKTIESLIYSFDDGFEQPTAIQLEGELFRDPFGGNVVLGEITVDKDIRFPVRLKDDGAYYFYLVSEIKDGLTHTVGAVHASRDLKHVWIKLDVIDERYGVDGYVFGPAQSMEEANELIKANILKTFD
ncbi:hypothetical protein MO973_04305 [Paenibacillus sp. TRM 82003]|nr:hypothetical protein [Paenibacillus sp. TRM 82003]